MRDIAIHFILHKVGTGEHIFLWLHPWHLDGVLHETYGHRIICVAGSQLDARLSTAIQDKNWYWLEARSENLVKIKSKWSLVSIGDMDQPTWSISKKGFYNYADT